jgi:hypothetical protein
MKPIDIESWVLDIIKRVESKQPIEDCRIELKADWPSDTYKAARQIAGHANAAHGEPILWLIGVDEEKGVTGADYKEISNWKQTIDSKFDEISPTLIHLNVPYQGKTVVALVWETDRAPYLVKNPKGGPISLEVPWRDGCSTRTAKRTNLLTILYPVSKNPQFEVLDGYLNISQDQQDETGFVVSYGGLKLYVYITPRNEGRIVIPFHKCQGRLRFIDSNLCVIFNNIWFESSEDVFYGSGIKVSYPEQKTYSISCTSTEVVINGPGMAVLKSDTPNIPKDKMPDAYGDIELEVKVFEANGDIPIYIKAVLSKTNELPPKGSIGKWELKPAQMQ